MMTTKNCPNCGLAVSDEYRFCLECGTDLSTATDSQEPPPTLVLPASTQPPPSTPNAGGGSQAKSPQSTIIFQGPSQVHQSVSSQADPPSSKLPWYLLGICVLAIGVLGYLTIFRNKTSESDNAITQLQSATPLPSTMLSPDATTSPAATSSPTATPSPTITRSPTASPSPTMTASPAAATVPTPTPTSTPSAEPTKAPVETPKVYTGREVDQRVMILSKPQPVYTEEARKNQIFGKVVLKVVFGANGSVESVSVVSGLPNGLTERAIAAARSIKFVPAQKDGIAVSTSMQVEYVFNLY